MEKLSEKDYQNLGQKDIILYLLQVNIKIDYLQRLLLTGFLVIFPKYLFL